MYFRNLGILFVLITPLVAGFSMFGDITVHGYNYTGIVWASMLLAAVWLTVVLRTSGWKVGMYGAANWWPWAILFGFMWLSLAWCEKPSSSNVQDAMQLSMPLVVGIVAESAIRTRRELQRLMLMFAVILVPLAIFSIAFADDVFTRWGLQTQQRAAALTATLAGCVLLSRFPDKKVIPLVGWGTALLVTVFTSSRMATFALTLAPALHLGYRSYKGNLIAVGGFVAIVAMLFSTPAFQDRFFYSGTGNMEDVLGDDFDSAGRFDAWPEVWQESQKNPVLGAGVGVSRQFVPTIWPDMYHVHNDYLRVIFELGWVGLAIFVSVYVWQLHALWEPARTTTGILRSAFVAAWLGFWMLLITSATDNTIIYNLFYTDPLFAVLGAAWGVYAQEQSTAEAPQRATRGLTV